MALIGFKATRLSRDFFKSFHVEKLLAALYLKAPKKLYFKGCPALSG